MSGPMIAAKPKLHLVEEAEGPVGSVDGAQLIREGNYSAVFVRCTTISLKMFGGACRLILDLRIVDPGEAFGTIICKFYRLKRLTSKPGRNGSFVVGKRAEVFLTLSRLTPHKLRPDRLSPKEVLRGHILAVKVRTVTTDYRGRPLAPALHYSVVDEIERICT